MTEQVTVTLPNQLYKRVQRLAQTKQRQLAETIVDHLEATLPFTESVPSSDEMHMNQSAALAHEEAAYVRLHPQLQLTHLGRYVAIYQGKLIDEDDTLGPMVERVRSKLPNQVVWMTQVKAEPIQTLIKRGNRLLRNGELNHYVIKLDGPASVVEITL